MAALAVLSLFRVYGARRFLDAELDANLLNVASIQAGAVTDAPTGEMVFHEWDLTPEEAAQVRELNRYAQIWSERMGAVHAHHVLQVAAPLTGRNNMLRQLAWLLLAITLLSDSTRNAAAAGSGAMRLGPPGLQFRS